MRDQIARLLRAHGYQVITTLPRVGGTGQYLELAKDNRLTAFVTADLEEGRHHSCVTFLLWDGATGSVQGLGPFGHVANIRAIQSRGLLELRERLG